MAQARRPRDRRFLNQATTRVVALLSANDTEERRRRESGNGPAM
jgi:hypothetical protein